MKKKPSPTLSFLFRLMCILMIVLIQFPIITLGFEFGRDNILIQNLLSFNSTSNSSLLVVFSNTAAISVADKAGGTGTPNGISNPYPSTINVSGLTGTVSDVNVTITGITTARERDLNFALVAPNGAALMLLGDGGDLNGMSNVTLTFDDSAGSLVPNPGPITSGTYRPSDYLFSATDSDTFPAPGPSTVNDPAPEGTATLASTFNGINPNGNWGLYIVDDSLGGGASSVSGGWSIDITTAGAVQSTSTTVASNMNPALTTQTITFTSTTTLVTGGLPVATGTVTFTDNGVAIAGCTNVPVNASGQATCMTTLPEGTRTIVANYNGTATFGPSSGSLSQVVNSPTIISGNQFCNNGGFTIADPGTANVYPSNISVSGLSGAIGKVTVQINGLTAPRPANLDFLLVGPGGQAFQFMSDVGDSVTPVNGINLTIDDAAASQLPIGTPLSGGTFRPTDFNAVGETDPYPPPAPATFSRPAPAGSETFASVYNITAPNGNWALYSVDDSVGGGTSSVGSWCINIIVTTAANATVEGRVLSTTSAGVYKAVVTMTDANGQIRYALTNPFGYFRFNDVLVGETYIFAVNAKNRTFTPQVISIDDNVSGLNFIEEVRK